MVNEIVQGAINSFGVVCLDQDDSSYTEFLLEQRSRSWCHRRIGHMEFEKSELKKNTFRTAFVPFMRKQFKLVIAHRRYVTEI